MKSLWHLLHSDDVIKLKRFFAIRLSSSVCGLKRTNVRIGRTIDLASATFTLGGRKLSEGDTSDKIPAGKNDLII